MFKSTRIVVATGHVAVDYGKNGKIPVYSANSHHVSSVFAMSQLIRQNCFHLPVRARLYHKYGKTGNTSRSVFLH